MKKILVLSDTHSFIDDRIINYASKVDFVIHAGDIGNIDVIKKLKLVSKLYCVYGNIDGNEIRSECNEFELLKIEKSKIILTHIAGKIPYYNKKTINKIKLHKPDILISGHSHILKIQFDKKNNLLFINPGAAGKHGFHKKRTMIRFCITNGKLSDMEIIELGNKTKLSNSIR